MAIDYAKKAALDKKYKGVTFKGATFPDAKYKYVDVNLNRDMVNTYIPARDRVLKDATLGAKLLVTIFAFQEGFYVGSRSFKTNNPGNIGNTDSGGNTHIGSLDAGIKLQYDFFVNVAKGGNSKYPLGKAKFIPEFYSKEIDRHPEYGLPCNLPAYDFGIYLNQLDQFIKIYSTGARVGNNYINRTVSFFKDHGLIITPTTTLAEILAMDIAA